MKTAGPEEGRRLFDQGLVSHATGELEVTDGILVLLATIVNVSEPVGGGAHVVALAIAPQQGPISGFRLQEFAQFHASLGQTVVGGLGPLVIGIVLNVEAVSLFCQGPFLVLGQQGGVFEEVHLGVRAVGGRRGQGTGARGRGRHHAGRANDRLAGVEFDHVAVGLFLVLRVLGTPGTLLGGSGFGRNFAGLVPGQESFFRGEFGTGGVARLLQRLLAGGIFGIHQCQRGPL